MPKRSKTDVKRVRAIADHEIDLSDCPEITAAQIKRGVVRRNLNPIERKTRVNIMLSRRVIEWFKAAAGGRGYQTLINQMLEQSIDRESFESLLRRIIREEVCGTAKKRAKIA